MRWNIRFYSTTTVLHSIESAELFSIVVLFILWIFVTEDGIMLLNRSYVEMKITKSEWDLLTRIIATLVN